MNTKLSGAQSILVPITKVGPNKFPYTENLRGRVIKYIDFYSCQYLPDTDATGLQSTIDMFVTLYNESGNTKLHDSLPLERFDYQQTVGVRQPIFSTLSIENSYIDCQDISQVGTTAMLIFWYDLPEYSARNRTDKVITDSVTIPLTTAVRYNALPNIDRMINKRFRYILAAKPTYTPEQLQALPAARLENVYLTLRKGSYTVCDNIPVLMLYQLQQVVKSEFANIVFDFQSSYLTIGGAGTIPNVVTDYVGYNVFLNLQYEK